MRCMCALVLKLYGGVMKTRIILLLIFLALTPAVCFGAKTLPNGIKVGDNVEIRFEGSEGYSAVKIMEYDRKGGWIRCKRKNDTIWANVDKLIAIKK